MYIDIQDVIREIKITYKEIVSFTKNGYVKDFIADTIGITKISISDYTVLKEDSEYIKNAYSVADVSRLLLCSKQTAFEYINKHFSEDSRKVWGKKYTSKSIVDSYISNNPYLKLIASNEYIPLKDLSSQYNLGTKQLSGLLNIEKNEKVFFHPLSKIYYVHKSEISRITSAEKITSNSYSSTDLCDIFKCTYIELNRYMDRICKLFKTHKEINKHHYFDKSEVNSFVENLHKQGFTQIIDYFNKKKRGVRAQITPKTQIDINHKVYYSTKKVSEIFGGVSTVAVIDNIKKGNFTDFHFDGKQYYVNRDEINSIKSFLDNSIELINIDKEIISDSERRRITVNGLINQYFPNAQKYNIFCVSTWRVPYFDIENYKLKYLPDVKKAEVIQNETNPIVLFDLLTERVKYTPFQKTFKLFKEYAYDKIDKTHAKNIRVFAQHLANTLIKITEAINKELFLHTDEELNELIKSPDFTSTSKLHMGTFLNYCNDNYRSICKYNNRYNRYIVSDTDELTSNIYPLDKWIDYAIYLTDLDRHIVKAFENAKYAKIWLYTILHLSIAWRREDILGIPSISLVDGIGAYDLEWFKNNLFTMTHAQKIINSIKTLLGPIRANKNGIKAHFIVLPYFVIPTAIAFITAEYHRKRANEEGIFGKSKFFKSDFEKFFEVKSLADFSNIKACRSLITHNFNQAVKSEGMADLAYSLSMYLRSHKFKLEFENSETTAQYIYSTNTDGDASNVAHHLFRRGVFGWLYHSIIKIATGSNKLSMEEMTTYIESLKKEYTPFAIDSLSYYLDVEYEERKSIVIELLTKPREEMWDFLTAIETRKLSSKTDDIDCLKYNGIKHECPYKLNISCTGCKYKIPTNYALSIVKVELDELIQKLEKTADDDYVYRQKYTWLIVKLLSLIAEARSEFSKWDKDYINSFIDLIELDKKIKQLQASKFLMLKK